MAEKKRIQVTIDQKRLTLVGNESEEYLRSLSNYLNGKIGELRAGPAAAVLDRDLFYVLLAVNLTDDYFKLHGENVELAETVRLQEEDLCRLREQLEDLESLDGEVPASAETGTENGETNPSSSSETEEVPENGEAIGGLTGGETTALSEKAEGGTEAEAQEPVKQIQPAADMELGRRYAAATARISVLEAEKADLLAKLNQMKALVGQLESKDRPVELTELQDENLGLRQENDRLRERLEEWEAEHAQE